MMPSRRLKDSVPSTFRCISQERQQCCGKSFGSAMPLEKFGYDVFAEDEIGEDHGRDLENETCCDRLDQ